jgi:hypothetical protein
MLTFALGSTNYLPPTCVYTVYNMEVFPWLYIHTPPPPHHSVEKAFKKSFKKPFTQREKSERGKECRPTGRRKRAGIKAEANKSVGLCQCAPSAICTCSNSRCIYFAVKKKGSIRFVTSKKILNLYGTSD